MLPWKFTIYRSWTWSYFNWRSTNRTHNKLRKLITKRSKYREPSIICWDNFQINKYKNKFRYQKFNPILNNAFVKEALEKPQHDFVVVPINKAVNNVSFVCKGFFATVLIKEFGVIGTPSKTYKLMSDNNKNILINSTVNEIKQHFLMSISGNIKVFRTLYLIPKLH